MPSFQIETWTIAPKGQTLVVFGWTGATSKDMHEYLEGCLPDRGIRQVLVVTASIIDTCFSNDLPQQTVRAVRDIVKDEAVLCMHCSGGGSIYAPFARRLLNVKGVIADSAPVYLSPSALFRVYAIATSWIVAMCVYVLAFVCIPFLSDHAANSYAAYDTKSVIPHVFFVGGDDPLCPKVPPGTFVEADRRHLQLTETFQDLVRQQLVEWACASASPGAYECATKNEAT